MSDLKADWRTLEAGRELDRIIGQKLGWQFMILPNGYYQTVTPNGTTGGKYLRRKDSEFLLPGFSTDLNAAFTLFSTELGLEWNLFSDSCDDVTCEVGHWDVDSGYIVQQSSGNAKHANYQIAAAWAICRAMLAWWERTDHPAPELPKGTDE